MPDSDEKRLLAMHREYQAFHILSLQRRVNNLTKAMCVYAREELGNMNFETDNEVVEYFLEFSKEEPDAQ